MSKLKSEARGGLAAEVAEMSREKKPAKVKKEKKAKTVKERKERKPGKMAFIRDLLTAGGFTKDEITEKAMKAFPGASEKTTKSTVSWTATKLGSKAKYVKAAKVKEKQEAVAA